MTDPSPFSVLDESAAALAKGRNRVLPMGPVNAIRRGAAAFRKACLKPMPAVVENVLFFGGLTSVVYGCWTIWHPLGSLVGGGLAVWLGMLIALERQTGPPP